MSSAAGTPINSFSSAELAGNLVQFVDDGNEVAPAFSVQVNDGALDSNVLAATISYTPVNDAPTLGNGTLAAVNEDSVSPAGQSVSTIFSGQFADVDAGSSLGGIAIVGNTANSVTQGSWQYSSNGGTNWFAVGAVADGATALAISSTSLMRFVPVADYNGTPSALTVRGLDNSYVAGFSSTAGSETRVSVNTSSNGGTTAIAAATATLSTSITPVNDAPVITSGGSASLDENANASTVVYVVTATDVDTGIDGQVSYSLTGVDAALLSINAAGEVRLNASADFETKPGYSFNVVATDGGGLVNVRAVSLVINNLDEVAPTITSGAAAGAIDENSGAGQVVYTVTSTDAGDIATGSTSYSLKPLSGDAAAFSINASSDAVTLTGNPDFEGKSSYSFTVVATDAAGNASEKVVTLTINNLPDAAPTATNLDVAETYIEDIALDLADIVVTDVDSPDVTVTLTLSDAQAGSLSTGTAGGSNALYVAASGVWRASGASADVNSLLASLRFMPAADFNGGFSISASVSDGLFTVTGSKAITGMPVNDAPAGSDIALATATGTPHVFSAADFGFRDTRDVPANAWAGVRIATMVSSGTLTVAGVPVAEGQTISAVEIASGQLVFTPAENEAGAVLAAFAFQVRDDGGVAAGGVDTDAVARTVALTVAAPPDVVIPVVVESPPAAEPPILVRVVVIETASPPPPARLAATVGRVAPQPGPDSAPVAHRAFDVGAVVTSFAVDFTSLVARGAVPDRSVEGRIANLGDLLEPTRTQLLRFSAPQIAAVAPAARAPAMPGLSAGVPRSPTDLQDQQAAQFGLSAEASARVAGVLVAAGFVTWAIRAAGLLSTMLLSMPVWRSVDPLPILAPDEDRPKWRTDSEQEREEAAMSALWNTRTEDELDEEMQ